MDADLPSENQPSSHFPLLSLPAELRNYIYELSLPDKQTFAVGPWKPITRPMQPPLTRVSKQIRYETLGLFVTKNNFRIRGTTDFQRERESSIGFSPSISHLLQNVAVEICPYSGKYSVAVRKDTDGTWICNVEGNRDFHLPTHHVEFWTMWLNNLSIYKDDDDNIRSKDLESLVKRLQKWY